MIYTNHLSLSHHSFRRLGKRFFIYFLFLFLPFFLCHQEFIHCETWTAPVDLSAVGEDATCPHVSMNDSGQAVVVWLKGLFTEATTSTFGEAWTAPVILTSSLNKGTYSTRVKINSNGEALAVWGGEYGLLSSDLLFGKAWSDADSVYFDNLENHSYLSMNASGQAVVVIEKSGASDRITAVKHDFGGDWQDESYISDFGLGANHAVIALNDKGFIIALWEEDDRQTGTRRVKAKIAKFAGTWSSTFPLYGTQISSLAQSAQMPNIAFNNIGEGVAIWKQYNGASWIIQAATINLGGKWSSPVALSVTGQDADLPQVVINNSGQAIAVWKRSDGINDIIQVATLTFGGSWSAPVNLSAAGEDASNPEVAVNDAGQAVAAWWRTNGTNKLIQVATLNFGQSWSSPVDLSATGQDAHESKIVLNAKGEAACVWQRSNGTNEIIQVATTCVKPLPPINLIGVQKKLYNKGVFSYFNRLRWTSSSTGNVVSYNIYREGVLIATVNNNKSKYVYEDRNQAQGVPVNYAVSAVTGGGAESGQVSISVP